MSEIITHLKTNPQFRKINTSSSIKKLIDVLPLKLKRGIKFAYIKRQTLYFVLTHPVFKMEFEYNKADIKSLLKKSNMEDVNDIDFFVTNKIERKKKKVIIEPTFKERSHGIFENNIKDEKLHQKMEEIRKVIKNS